MKITLPILTAVIALTFASCTKEPSACFTASNDNPEVFEVVTFNNCSEDAESYDWIMQTDFIEGTSRAENPTFTWDVDGTFNVELEATSKNDKKSDVTSQSITVVDVCYECESEFFTTDVCASGYFTKANFETAVDSYENSGYDCTKK